LNELTSRELNAAIHLNQIGALNNVIEGLVNKDYYSCEVAFPKRFDLENSLNPTDPFKGMEKYLISCDKSNLKLL
jgi:hypothetical protein